MAFREVSWISLEAAEGGFVFVVDDIVQRSAELDLKINGDARKRSCWKR